jgi:transglutaminase-like putative cysteine protease
MHIRYGYRVDVLCETPITITTRLDVHPSRRGELTMADAMVARPVCALRDTVPTLENLDDFNNLCREINVPAGGVALRARGIIYHSGFVEERSPEAEALPPDQLPPEVIPLLDVSPGCDARDFDDQARQRLEGVEGGWARVEAICHFVRQHMRFDARLAQTTRTASEAYQQQVGASRDYAQIAIAFCRQAGIPARFCVGYTPQLDSDDDVVEAGFTAWFEAYLGGHWWTFDPARARLRIGHILVARGRDALDVPVVTATGAYTLGVFRVGAEEVDGARFPVSSAGRRAHHARLVQISGNGR